MWGILRFFLEIVVKSKLLTTSLFINMYCSNCGKHSSEDSKFCQYCGAKLGVKKVTVEAVQDRKISSIITKISDEDLEKLRKRYKGTADTSIALSIGAPILTFFLSLDKYSVFDAFLGILISVPFLIPFYYFGRKLKKTGADNLESALKISRGMLIYTAIFCLANLAMGGLGFLWLFLLYYYYKSYKETKNLIKKSTKTI